MNSRHARDEDLEQWPLAEPAQERPVDAKEREPELACIAATNRRANGTMSWESGASERGMRLGRDLPNVGGH
jgi:hypothetical protein